MNITVTTSSTSLQDLLSDVQTDKIKGKMVNSIQRRNRMNDIEIYNKGDNTIFYDKHVNVSPSTGIPIRAKEYMAFKDVTLKTLHLISETSDNADIRVAIK